jgi:hypothetical protein
MTQRACLERAVGLIAAVPGVALELGWGDGAAYDHLREILRRREIIVFDEKIVAADGALPPLEHRVTGDLRETLPQAWEGWRRNAALAHLNFPITEAPRLAAEIAPLIAPLLRPGAIVVSEIALDLPGWQALPPPEGVREGRHHLYRAS